MRRVCGVAGLPAKLASRLKKKTRRETTARPSVRFMHGIVAHDLVA
jgi:hypothetical protein